MDTRATSDPIASFEFTAEVWLVPDHGGWHFATLPVELASEIRELVAPSSPWGSVPVTVRIGQTEWKTSIFPNRGAKSYDLPLKAEVRRLEEIAEGDDIAVVIEV